MIDVKRFTLFGILLISLATLTLEVVLTRVFSVMTAYHFAFMVISLALLGSGIAGVWLYLLPHWFPPEKTAQRLAFLSAGFGVATAVSFILYLQIPFRFATIFRDGISWGELGWMTLIYLILAIPFLLSGATIALSISQFSQTVGRVYFFDLVGASLGCLLSLVALTQLGASGTVLFIAVLGGVAGLLFASSAEQGRKTAVSVTGAITLILLGLFASNLTGDWLKVRKYSTYDQDEWRKIVFEEWNALSRITVHEDPGWEQPFGWGLSPTYEGPDPGHLLLLIDADAGTPLQKWDGSMEMIDFLRYDLTAVAYYILPDARTFIIGSGGGRDIMTGLLFEAEHITGAELNPLIVRTARDVYGDYVGNVYNAPNLTIEIGDARTIITRSEEEYDLIQASLIDTWAAASSGAYSLSENGLYTQDAFQTYFDHLTDRGMVSYSRWYYLEEPTETLRLVALGMSSWEAMGVDNPADHMVVIGNFTEERSTGNGLATMLLKRTPFTAEEVATLNEVVQQLDFSILHAPHITPSPNPVSEFVTGDWQTAVAQYPLDISVPTDNQPFFFNYLPPLSGRQVGEEWDDVPAYQGSIQANVALLAVLGISALAALLFIIAPMLLRRRQTLDLKQGWPFLTYYAAIGVGFMLVLVTSIQKLTIYLGSPTYSLTVVLFTILLSSGIGSRTTQTAVNIRQRIQLAIGALLGIIVLQVLLIPPLVLATQQWPLWARAFLVMLVIFPAGFCMGQPFPLGIRYVSQHQPKIIPWLWSINGATSVIGSALATVLSLSVGFMVVSFIGLGCYLVALLLAVRVWERPLATTTPNLATTD